MQIDITQQDGLNQLTPSQVGNIIDSMDATQFLKNQAYFEGENTAIIEFSENKDSTPNNEIPLPFARKTVNDIVGYSGKPGLIQYQISQDQEESKIDLYNDIVKRSNLWLVTSEVYQDTLIKGEGAELAWTDSEGMLRFSSIPREQCQFFYDNTVEEKLLFSVRSYKQRHVKADGSIYYKGYAVVYWADHIDYYETDNFDEIKTEYDPQSSKDQYSGRTNWISTYKFLRTETHLLGHVTLYPYRVNSDRKGIFQPSLPIIDRLDMFGSDSIANELDRYNQALLTLSKKLDKESATKIKEWNVIDDLGTEGDFIKYVKREMDMQSSVDGFKLFERLYYELNSVPNMNDEKFNQKSGIAIAYALVPFENLVAQIETYFNQGLEYRFKIINFYLGYKDNNGLTYTINWTRNLPFDFANTVEIVFKLKQAGILSDETLLKLFPESIVLDAQEEIERREKEITERAARQIVTAELLTAEPQDKTEE